MENISIVMAQDITASGKTTNSMALALNFGQTTVSIKDTMRIQRKKEREDMSGLMETNSMECGTTMS